MRRLIWNPEEQTIRGSFVCLVQTIFVLCLVIAGACSDAIAGRLHTMETLILGFFTVSFGVWTGKKVFEEMGRRIPGGGGT